MTNQENCPKAVQLTLMREAGGRKIEEIEKGNEDGKSNYEAKIVVDGADYELKVRANGTLISKILEGDDDEDDDDEDGVDNDDDDE